MKRNNETMIFSEVVDSPKSAQEFMQNNGIKNAMVVVIWMEDISI